MAHHEILQEREIRCPGLPVDQRAGGKEKLMGMLETTWHIYHGGHYPYVHATAAYAAWNPAVNPMTSLATRLSVAMHMRQIGWDMDVVDYEKTGWNQYQVDPGHHPHPVS